MRLTIHGVVRAKQRIKEFANEDFYTIQSILNLAIKDKTPEPHPTDERFQGYFVGRYIICTDKVGNIVNVFYRNRLDYYRWQQDKNNEQQAHQ